MAKALKLPSPRTTLCDLSPFPASLGQRTIEFPNGDKYLGGFKNKKPDGEVNIGTHPVPLQSTECLTWLTLLDGAVQGGDELCRWPSLQRVIQRREEAWQGASLIAANPTLAAPVLPIVRATSAWPVVALALG